MNTTPQLAADIPAIDHAEAMRLTAAENARLLDQLRGLSDEQPFVALGDHLLGIPPTGKSVIVEAWAIDRFRNGQLVESRILMDVVGLLGQLGAIPAQGGGD